MEEKCGSGNVSGRPSRVPSSEKKFKLAEKRDFREKSEVDRKRVKMRDLDSVIRSEGIDTRNPKPLGNKEGDKIGNSQVMVESLTMNPDNAETGKTGRGSLILQVEPTTVCIDLSTKHGAANKLDGGGTVRSANKLLSSGKHGIEQDATSVVAPRAFALDLNTGEVSSSLKQDPLNPHRGTESVKRRGVSQCGSTTGPTEEKDPMRVWKEMKQNGFLSSTTHGGIPVPITKPRGRKTKIDGIKKKMELAKKEQVDRFAMVAAPSGLLNDLNPGIINHVRNSKQVHSIIEALVKSEELENRNAGSKQGVYSKSGTKEFCYKKKDLDILNGLGMHQFNLSQGEGFLHSSSRSQDIRGCPISPSDSRYLNSDHSGGDGDCSIIDKMVFSKSFCPSHSKLNCEDDVLALKLSSPTPMASDDFSSLSNADSASSSSVSSLSVKAANVALQWLELLHQDIKGRLAALRRSRKRVRAVIHTELPFLMRREFSSNQENDPYAAQKFDAGCCDNASVNAHRTKWSALFDQMDKALSVEDEQLESWLNQVKEMQQHCEGGLQHFYAILHALQQQQQGTSESSSRLLEKADNLDKELAVRAAAASIYSTCNFLLSMETLPCL